MGLPQFFRTYQHKVFNYIPIYYDQRKEELEEQIRRSKAEAGIKDDKEIKYVPGISRGAFRGNIRQTKKIKKHSSIRLLIIFIILVLITYAIFFS